MLHHQRLRPPSQDHPADERDLIERRFHPELLAQFETMPALISIMQSKTRGRVERSGEPGGGTPRGSLALATGSSHGAGYG